MKHTDSEILKQLFNNSGKIFRAIAQPFYSLKVRFHHRIFATDSLTHSLWRTLKYQNPSHFCLIWRRLCRWSFGPATESLWRIFRPVGPIPGHIFCTGNSNRVTFVCLWQRVRQWIRWTNPMVGVVRTFNRPKNRSTYCSNNVRTISEMFEQKTFFKCT
jgi:hypothetical protein